MKGYYCSICMKPTETYDHYERIDDEFGTQVHGPFIYSKCCQDEAWTREEWAKEVQLLWNIRRESRSRKAMSDGQKNAIFNEILKNFIKRAA